ncbi:MAG: FAD-binding protein, partial [Erysipelothrix sp.]|nr:FAD-binding protein [Erysipelothrix sp.]
MYHQISEEDVAYFKTIVKEQDLYVGSQIHKQYTHDEMELYGKYLPDVVIKVENADEIQAIVKYCNDYRIPITPRGSGTGLCGGCVALYYYAAKYNYLVVGTDNWSELKVGYFT